jgi:hypothetical protein
MLRLPTLPAIASRSAVSRRFASATPSWATMDPHQLGVDTTPYHVSNCVSGRWNQDPPSKIVIPHPLDKLAPPIFTIPDTQADQVQPFIESLRACPKTGLHNPLKYPERYVQYGEISRKVSLPTLTSTEAQSNTMGFPPFCCIFISYIVLYRIVLHCILLYCMVTPHDMLLYRRAMP